MTDEVIAARSADESRIKAEVAVGKTLETNFQDAFRQVALM